MQNSNIDSSRCEKNELSSKICWICFLQSVNLILDNLFPDHQHRMKAIAVTIRYPLKKITD